jgi:hypothetical protein
LCAEVACAGGEEARRVYFDAAWSGDDGARRRFGAVVAETVVDVGEDTLLGCLANAVAEARYWQEPDEEDALLADPRIMEALRPVAEAVVGSRTWRWWTTPLDAHAQAFVQWMGENGTVPPRLIGAEGGLRQWRQETVKDERDAAGRPDDPAAPYSGCWWSTPALGRVVATSRARPGLAATQLMLVEDASGWTQAQVWPLRPAAGIKVYEIDGPQAWVRLVERYPLDVSRSRRHDWWRTTGRAERWLIPDWHAVADDHDAVHLTVAAYLTTAGRALDMDGGATVLAGWDPDITFWLTDTLTSAGKPVIWQRHDDDRWHLLG